MASALENLSESLALPGGFELFSLRLDSAGILHAGIDMPGRTMNVFSSGLMDELERVLDLVRDDPRIRGVLLFSGKSSFLAGADLPMVRGFTERAKRATREETFRFCGRLGRLFVRLENSDKPWVAAVAGTALGGGLELAMACQSRLLDPSCQALIGLPEIKLGLLPGAGGTQRLPRLVGYELGMDMLLTGRALNPAQAIEAGLFESAPAAGNEALLNAARARLQALLAIPLAQRLVTKFAHAQFEAPADSDAAMRSVARQFKISDEQIRDYPAYRTTIHCVLAGRGLALDPATDVEMKLFIDLMFDPVAGRMVSTLFIARQRVERAALAPALALRAKPSALPALDPQVLSQQAKALAWPANDGPVWPMHTLRWPELPECNVVLSGQSKHGRVIEWLDAQAADLASDAPLRQALATLAVHSKALLLINPTSTSLLLAWQSAHSSTSEDDQLQLAQASRKSFEILARWPQTMVPIWPIDFQALDVAAVLSGACPAYLGGPMYYVVEALETAPNNERKFGPDFRQFKDQLLTAYAATT